MERPFWTRTPQPEQLWLEEAGGTATTRRPAQAAWEVRILKNALHPASWMLLARW
jgi:hypothetical protein